MDIPTLLKKLGHHLEEIRIRALKNLISKLDHGLISTYDLVQEKILYRHLLEWFNFPKVPMQEEVLDLLTRLAKHPTAVCLLGDIGAVEFMSQLRSNLEPNLQAKVDEVLDCLFRLPDIPADDQVSSYHLQPLTRLADQVHVSEQPEVLPGYFNDISNFLRHEVPPLPAGINDAVKCLKFSTFPWLTLTSTDKHILSSNESLLQSQDQRLVRNTCELLQDVIMQDFPAEIFLQRPKIVQSLLSLMKLAFSGDATHHLALQAVSCLHQLCTCLRIRLSFYRDPNFFSTKQETSSQNSSVSYSQETRVPQQSPDQSPVSSSPRPFVIGRTGLRPQGDGQDGDAASSSGSSSRANGNSRASTQSPLDVHLDLTEIENEASLELQFQQLSLAQFSVMLLENAVPLLRTGSRRVLLQVLELLKDNLLLLSSSLSAHVWNDDSRIGQELNEKLLTSLESLGETVIYHNSSACLEQPELSLEHHRMAFVSIAIFAVRLLQTLLPVEKADEVLPESMATALFQVSVDMPFCLTYPNIHESITAYLEVLNAENYRLYKRATEIVHSFECTGSFMGDTDMQNEKHFLELVEAASHAVSSLPYHKHLPLVQKFISLCSKICKSAQASLSVQDGSRKVYLKLLSHPVLAVKVEAYRFSLDITKECLGIYNVTKPVSSVCHGINFLLHTSVLYEISAFGLQDSAEQVNSAAKEILLYLLQGQLMMTALTWNKLIDALYPVIPILQGFASTEGSLSNCILMLSETSSETGDGIFPRIARLRAALRLLMSMQKAVRSTALKHLMWHLINENEANVKRPLLEGNNLSAAANMYIIDKRMDLKLDDAGRSLFKDETVGKIYEIFTSEAVDLVVRKSAAEQLAVMMQDITKHEILMQLGVIDKLQSLIQECIHKNGKPMECIMLPCLTLLRKLIYADPPLRHNLAQQPSLLLSLFRVSVILQDKQAVLMEVAALFSLLLFDEVARTDTWSDDQLGNSESSPPPPFSLPVAVLRRYHLPVQIASHHAVSPYCCVVPAPSDPLMSKPVGNMLSIAWNLAWFNGIENLLEKMKNRERESEEFLETLRLSPSDVTALTVTHIDSGLRACISSIAQAVSHRQVSAAVSKMSIYLLNDSMALNFDSNGSLAILQCLEWHTVLKRFLQVLPACSDDEKLLADVVTFLNKYCIEQKKQNNVSDLNWFLELLLKEETNPLLNLLVQVESRMQNELDELQTAVRQKLQKELSALFNTILLSLTSSTDRKCLVLAGLFRTELSLKLLQCVRVSDAPHFYGLPSLERTLRGMVHVTACPGWSLHSVAVEPFSICVKYLTSLLEVISSFYVEWGGNALSFMGKGVTKNAVLCLLHITSEMRNNAQLKDWVSLWSLPYDHNIEEQATSRMGLAWLVPLWVDRDPEVRFASLSIGAALTSIETGCITLAASCQNISGGLWGMLLNILLDQSECSMVRREAAAVLQNLLVMPMPSTLEEASNSTWQSPCVHDEEAGVSLVGVPALQVLLHHCLFYECVSQMAHACYLGRHSFELNFPELGRKEGRSSTEDFEDSLKHWRGEFGQPSQVHSTAGSLSTSSTQIAAVSSLLLSAEGLQLGGEMLSENYNAASISRPNAEVQGETDTVVSTNTEDSPVFAFSADQNAIVTPAFLSAVCGLLTNLMVVTPEDTLISLQQNHILISFSRLANAGLLERCLWDLKTPFPHHSYLEDTTVQILCLLQYLSSLSEFLQCCLILKPDIVIQDDLKPLLSNVFTCLSIHLPENFDAELTSAFHQTWTDLFTLLTCLLRKTGQISLSLITTLLSKHWTKVIGKISTSAHLSATSPFLYTAALQFLAVLLAEEGRRKLKNEQSSFPSPTITKHLDGSDGKKASGKHLCDVVLQSYEGNSSESFVRKMSANALMSLLAVSTSAQKHALQAGFLDSCIEQMKQIHAQLNLDYMQTEKTGQRKKEETLIKELKTTMQILRNCLYRNNECKIAAVESRLAIIIYSLWPWFVMDDVLMQAALQLLSVFTANCPAACGSVCWVSSVQYSQTSQRGPTGNTLMHAVMKISSQKVPGNSVIQQLAFTVLSNLAVSHDCRGVLQKSNFLQHFVSLPLPKLGSKKLSTVTTLWLKLLLNISFGDDGQQMIVKFNGCLELLTEMTRCKHKCSQPVALLILHNICFSPTSKPKILASDSIITTLASCLESDSLMIQTIGASALWALMYNNQKAKVPLKNPSVRRRVDEAYSSVKKIISEADDDPLRLYNLKCLDALTRLLNL
ncbi:rotatin [Protopterus annectens]|uniref:rotatin n=1 Tax=Protopterus annectens TaxID=7888 RepID=UPI001CFA4CAC|nr:rotatin [Protopterus annectens]